MFDLVEVSQFYFFLEAQPNYLFVYVSLTQSGHFLNPFACVTYSLVNDEILPSPLTIVFSCNLISFIFLLKSSIHSSTSLNSLVEDNALTTNLIILEQRFLYCCEPANLGSSRTSFPLTSSIIPIHTSLVHLL